MSNHDSNHSSGQRTILWIIIPATIFVSLLFTRLNHKMPPPHEQLKSDYSQMKKAAEHAPAHEVMPTAPMDTVTHPESAPAMHAPAEAHGAHEEAPKH